MTKTDLNYRDQNGCWNCKHECGTPIPDEYPDYECGLVTNTHAKYVNPQGICDKWEDVPRPFLKAVLFLRSRGVDV